MKIITEQKNSELRRFITSKPDTFKPEYNIIAQIGDRDDTGNTAETEKEALKRFADYRCTT